MFTSDRHQRRAHAPAPYPWPIVVVRHAGNAGRKRRRPSRRKCWPPRRRPSFRTTSKAIEPQEYLAV